MRAFFQGAAVAYPVFTLMVFVDSLSHQRPGGESSWLMHFLVAAYIAAFPALFLGGVAAVWSHVGAEDKTSNRVRSTAGRLTGE